MFKQLNWDITGICNAQCRFCISGSKNVLSVTNKGQVGTLSPDDFSDGLDFLLQNKIISVNTEVQLFSWGEPFVHPQFELMLRIVASKGLVFTLSTNASLPKEIPYGTLWRLKSLVLSVPGFSQDSYDRQHGFNFKKICENIRYFSTIHSHSPGTEITMAFHAYKSNLHEIEAAKQFCDELGIGFYVLTGILTGISIPLIKDQIDTSNCLTDDWALVEKYRRSFEVEPECPQYEQLVIDENGYVLQCCVADRLVPGYRIGKLKEVDYSTLTAVRKNAEVCKTCTAKGIGFLAHNPGQDVVTFLKKV